MPSSLTVVRRYITTRNIQCPKILDVVSLPMFPPTPLRAKMSLQDIKTILSPNWNITAAFKRLKLALQTFIFPPHLFAAMCLHVVKLYSYCSHTY